jgi:hypothetical protein
MTDLNESIRSIHIPERMRSLPIDRRGYPVPWFVAMVDGEWDFRVIGPGKVITAIQRNKCWICRDHLGTYKAFVTGPMCTITRTSAEPPSHLDCAKYSVKACPFLTKPNMKRNDKDLPMEMVDPAGIFIKRNPGVTAIFITKIFKPLQVKRETRGSDILIRMGEPERIEWYAEGREATRAEVDHSMDTGLPLLVAEAEKEGALAELNQYKRRMQKWLPRETEDVGKDL